MNAKAIHGNKRRPIRIYTIRVAGWISIITLCHSLQVLAHLRETHQNIVEYAGQMASNLPTPLVIDPDRTAQLRQGAYDEDNTIVDPGNGAARPLNHAYNPITDKGFLGNGFIATTARNEITIRWASMAKAFADGNLDGGDNAGAWHYLGRVSHLMQDMTSPLHVMTIWHDGVIHPTCQFESYWGVNSGTTITLLKDIADPLHSHSLPREATDLLDVFSASRLHDRFENSCPNKGLDDPRGWVETMAWSTYFRTTFFGEVKMGFPGKFSSANGAATSATTSTTIFSDGTVNPQVNVLEKMFGAGNVRWINNFIGDDYYEITDRNGNVFRWMSAFDIDDWGSCGECIGDGQRDTSVLIGGNKSDDDGVRVTGRFYFNLRELGKDSSGKFNRYCYPRFLPNGDSTTEHVHEYFGNQLIPLATRYNSGLIGLANRQVTVRTTEATPTAGFQFSRSDNFGNGRAFRTGASGTNFYFAAKSPVTLTAPLYNVTLQKFSRWLRNGRDFDGNTNTSITINDGSLWIPERGVAYTAEYGSSSGAHGNGGLGSVGPTTGPTTESKRSGNGTTSTPPKWARKGHATFVPPTVTPPAMPSSDGPALFLKVRVAPRSEAVVETTTNLVDWVEDQRLTAGDKVESLIQLNVTPDTDNQTRFWRVRMP